MYPPPNWGGGEITALLVTGQTPMKLQGGPASEVPPSG